MSPKVAINFLCWLFSQREEQEPSHLSISLQVTVLTITSARPAAAAGPWHWFHICLSDDGATWTLECGHWALSAFCPDDLKPGFPRHSHRGRGPVGRGGHPTSPISGVINLQFYSLQLDDRHSTKPVQQHQDFYAFLLLKTY